MGRFRSGDGTELAYRLVGEGTPVVCLPGGPGRAAEYLGDLGGRIAGHTLVVLDNRGTGESGRPRDPDGYGMDRVVEDVEAMRRQLGLDRLTLLGHSSAANAVLLYAYRYPRRTSRLILVGPSTRVVGLPVDDFLDALARRGDEDWYPDAFAAMMKWANATTVAESLPHRGAASPFFYARWDEKSRAHAAAEPRQLAVPAAEGFYAGPTIPVDAVRRALAALPARVLVVVGELDPFPTPRTGRRLAELVGRGEAVIQPAAAHYPWVDDDHVFGRIIENFLDSS